MKKRDNQGAKGRCNLVRTQVDHFINETPTSFGYIIKKKIKRQLNEVLHIRKKLEKKKSAVP